MNRQTRRKDNKDERGSALVLTLGILSLVLIMGMSFAFSSRTSRQVAKVNADQVKANLHGESGLDYALGVMRKGFVDDGVQVIYPAGKKKPDGANEFEERCFEFRKQNLAFKDGSNWAHQHIWSYIPKDNKTDDSTDEEVETSDDSPDGFDTNKDKHSFYYTLMNEVPQLRLQMLQFVKETDDDENVPSADEKGKGSASEVQDYLKKIGFHTITSDDEIVGRVGFLVLEEGHKFDVNQMLTLKIPASGEGNIPFVLHDKLERMAGLDAIWEAKDYYYNITGDYKQTIKLNDEDDETIRGGLHIQELNANLNLNSGDPDYYKGLVNGAEIGDVSAKVRWMSYDHLWKGLCPADAELANIYNVSSFKHDHMRFTFFSAEEPESWWYEDDTDWFEVSRFDVTGYEWREDSNAPYYETIGTELHPATTAKANGWEDIAHATDKNERIQNLAFVKDSDGAKQEKDDLPRFSKKSDDYELSDCIPALADMKDKEEKSVALQVAANMVDYCDGDDYANYLTDPADVRDELTSTDKITSDFKIVYCGNEQVAYFNELALRFRVDRFHDLDEHTFRYTMKILPQLELANMFGDDNTHKDEVPKGNDVWEKIKVGKIVVRIKGTYEIKNCTNPTHGIAAPGSISAHPGNDSDEGNIDLVFQKNSDDETWDDGYAVIELEPVDNDVIFEYKENAEVVTVTDPDPAVPAGEPQDKAPSVDYTIKITEVSIVGWKDSADPVESEESDRVYDIGMWKASDLEDDSAKFTFDYGFTEAVNPSQGPTEFLFASLEANDPRCNHRTAGWAWVKKRVTGAPEFFVSEASEDVEDFSDSDFHTLGKDNKNFKPGSPDEYYGADGIMDKEKDSTKIYEISTAFIRNAPFETLWELGAIHRGEPFRTINLSILYDNDPDDFKGTYSDGDAHILDQVKIGPARYSRGKFNVNSRSAASYIMLYDKELFGKNDTYDKPTKKDGDDDLTEPVWDFKDAEPNISRGQIANLIANLDDDDAYDNDRQMESFIGRTANLLTTRNEAYTVIVISQALQERKDLSDAMTTAGMSDAQQKELIKTNMTNPTWYKVYEDADTHDKHLCEILGTNVIMAHVVRDAWTGKMTVVKKEYLNSSK